LQKIKKKFEIFVGKFGTKEQEIETCGKKSRKGANKGRESEKFFCAFSLKENIRKYIK
jgi:hypothetical protein